ncbi:RND family efflux transporter MFP subunit [Pseudomonas syringae pv. actinidiae ICMP 19071]|uniref:efflux RND transporter periplasmic adaptor subunit n=1 Tax=Pseudomonas syringae TaxID=317 RepID=UPI000357CBA6|nr:efflux RND transporter periplasmic adaptor subunit [Pseudomonas syringae]EPM53312.1 RND family efflux transporter MFP subunit [Pseudomonas syringae pv. actinidiae ICMP 19073]EPM61351.1 RND family efflux transporter MFP subunit [Pseudomonas syringae pv. actinidiae ICMP 19071]EPM79162.1 RND family efflux transporter MFP subunit [Pseudomonas syringae pv. actinidiae ICMP 19072]OSN63401.1 Multidrug resistance protein MdtE [Pseudomonas syringae pv. actinidiae]OSN72915.1 Multidrug resistance prote
MKRISCLLLGGLLLSGCGKEEAPPEPIRPVVFVEAQPESMQDFGRFAGNIQARYQSVLGFRVAGRIARRNVDVGSEVKKGDLLATLDPTDQQNNVRGRQGDLANVQAQWINAQAKARRQQELFDRGVGAQAQLDVALTDLKTASSSLEQAKAAAQQARDQLSYSELRSDHDAVVTEWKVEAGQVVTAGQEVVTLARPDIKEAVIDLPAALADQLPRDVVFTVASQLNPDINTTATIREIEPQADRTTRTRRARLSLAETPAAFRLGTAISVTLSSTITARMRLPINALQDIDGKRQIWIVDPQSQTVNPRDVNIISRDNDSFVLANGVKAGEKVVSAGVNSLKPGQKVKVDEESPR